MNYCWFLPGYTPYVCGNHHDPPRLRLAQKLQEPNPPGPSLRPGPVQKDPDPKIEASTGLKIWATNHN